MGVPLEAGAGEVGGRPGPSRRGGDCQIIRDVPSGEQTSIYISEEADRGQRHVFVTPSPQQGKGRVQQRDFCCLFLHNREECKGLIVHTSTFYMRFPTTDRRRRSMRYLYP